jgi:MFS family permease
MFLGEQTSWIRETSRQEKTALAAAFGGYAVDAFDYMIYTFMIPTLIAIWGMSTTEAGFIATGALLSSAVGGWAAGILADRYGRVRVLQHTSHPRASCGPLYHAGGGAGSRPERG